MRGQAHQPACETSPGRRSCPRQPAEAGSPPLGLHAAHVLLALALSAGLGSVGKGAEPVADRTSSWSGPVEASAERTPDGQPAGRWELAQGDKIEWRRQMAGVESANLLELWVHSARLSGAKIDVQVLAPDEDHVFSSRFSIEWTGWNKLQIEKARTP